MGGVWWTAVGLFVLRISLSSRCLLAHRGKGIEGAKTNEREQQQTMDDSRFEDSVYLVVLAKLTKPWSQRTRIIFSNHPKSL